MFLRNIQIGQQRIKLEYFNFLLNTKKYQKQYSILFGK